MRKGHWKINAALSRFNSHFQYLMLSLCEARLVKNSHFSGKSSNRIRHNSEGGEHFPCFIEVCFFYIFSMIYFSNTH